MSVFRSCRPSRESTRKVPASPLVTYATPSPNVTCCGARSAACETDPIARRRSAPAVIHSFPSGATPTSWAPNPGLRFEW